jgi:D-arabinose 1-dehydrogenase-like Zn-dependent alcohol dehydrogenase
VVCGATSGFATSINLRRVYRNQIEILGSSMGTREELADLMRLCVRHGVRPVVDSVFGFTQVREAFGRLASGEAFGKVMLDHAR